MIYIKLIFKIQKEAFNKYSFYSIDEGIKEWTENFCIILNFRYFYNKRRILRSSVCQKAMFIGWRRLFEDMCLLEEIR